MANKFSDASQIAALDVAISALEAGRVIGSKAERERNATILRDVRERVEQAMRKREEKGEGK